MLSTKTVKIDNIQFEIDVDEDLDILSVFIDGNDEDVFHLLNNRTLEELHRLARQEVEETLTEAAHERWAESRYTGI